MNDEALLRLLRLLKDHQYQFTVVTPATHARILERPCKTPTFRDIFGWNRWFARHDLEPDIFACLEQSSSLDQRSDQFRSKLRVASLGDQLLIHSAFPTSEPDSVFFGPDTYRFVRFIRAHWTTTASEPRCIVDMGTGSGAGAIVAASLAKRARVLAIDINPKALQLAAVNANAANVRIETIGAATIPGGSDLIIANPPYMMDGDKRAYRDGGDLLGGQLALEWTRQALRSLPAGGRMLLYSGAAITAGRAPLIDALQAACSAAGARLSIEELDPDVFGEDLGQPQYAQVERIAVIGAIIEKP